MLKNESNSEICKKTRRRLIQSRPVNLAAVRLVNTALQLALQAEDIAECSSGLQTAKCKSVRDLASSIEDLSKVYLAPRSTISSFA